MCKNVGTRSVPWKNDHKGPAIKLKIGADIEAAKEVFGYLNLPFIVYDFEIDSTTMSEETVRKVTVLINARANQIRTYRKRNKPVPSFKDFIEKRKQKEKSGNKNGE